MWKAYFKTSKIICVACFSIGKSPGNVLGKEKIASTFTLLEDKGD